MVMTNHKICSNNVFFFFNTIGRFVSQHENFLFNIWEYALPRILNEIIMGYKDVKR